MRPRTIGDCMYCGNCGMRLPDWAHFCEKCGARVTRGVAQDDPIEQVEADDTAIEPIWVEDEPAAEEVPLPGSPDGEPAGRDVSVGGMTVPMDMADASTGETGGMTAPIDMEELLTDSDVSQAKAAEDDQALEAPSTVDATSDRTEGDGSQGDTDATQLMDLEQADTGDEGGEPADASAEADSEGQDGKDEPKAGEADASQDEGGVPHVSRAGGGEEAPHAQGAALEPPVAPSPGQVIDAEVASPWLESDEVQGRYVIDPWQGRRRASERQSGGVPMALVAGIATGLMLICLVVAYRSLASRGAKGPEAPDGEATIVSKAVSADEASKVIAGLDGWWKTGRTYDGRYWHVQGGLMEVYAADGKLASQVLLDASSIEHLSTGPGGIEASGYYLRDIAFYLRDDDPDTLYAIGADGSANSDANLLRSEVPAFMGGDQLDFHDFESTPSEPGDASEYVLPESSTRVYEAWELEGLSDHDLFIARNEIYARHGYIFEGGELSEYFASKSWYLASDVFNEGDITEIERQNVSLILSIEQQRGSIYV